MNDSFSIFCSIVTAVVLEAAPFLLLGSLVGALFEVFVPSSALERITPKSSAGRVLFGLLAGLILPTCECGVVPVVRKLMAKGVHPQTALTYMFAAPVINPVVLLSTAVAFRGNAPMVAARVIMVALTAAGVGLFLGKRSPAKLLRPSLIPHDAHDHSHEPGCACGCSHDHDYPTLTAKLRGLMGHTADEFLSMGAWLILGACAAALFKTFTPAGILDAVSSGTAASTALLMLLAVILSVCSEADAFVAASFAGFSPVAQVAFTAVGPMVDLKLIAMFSAVFHKKTVLILTVVPIIAVYAMSLVLGWWGVLQ